MSGNEWKWEVGHRHDGSVIEAAARIGEAANGSYEPPTKEALESMVEWLRWRVGPEGWDRTAGTVWSSTEGDQFNASVRALALSALAYYDARKSGSI